VIIIIKTKYLFSLEDICGNEPLPENCLRELSIGGGWHQFLLRIKEIFSTIPEEWEPEIKYKFTPTRSTKLPNQ
jgi:hypothetical protein